MNVRLSKIENWPELAIKANWSVSKLAELSGVCQQTLRRYVEANWLQAPKKWMNEMRHAQAKVLLKNGESVKKTSGDLGYQNPETFCNGNSEKSTGNVQVNF